MSLENSFYATGDNIYTKGLEVTRIYKKAMEGNRMGWKVIESYRSLWKMQEHSTGKLGKQRETSPEVETRKERND